MRGVVRAVVFGVAVAVLGGCAMMDSRPPEVALKERAQQRLDALVAGDFKAAYQFLSPGSRAVTTSEAYAASVRQGFWKAARAEKVTCEKPDVCDVQLAIEYDYRGSRIKTPLRETWIKEGSNWWYVQK
jgi:hypothetical protein